MSSQFTTISATQSLICITLITIKISWLITTCQEKFQTSAIHYPLQVLNTTLSNVFHCYFQLTDEHLREAKPSNLHQQTQLCVSLLFPYLIMIRERHCHTRVTHVSCLTADSKGWISWSMRYLVYGAVVCCRIEEHVPHSQSSQTQCVMLLSRSNLSVVPFPIPLLKELEFRSIRYNVRRTDQASSGAL